MPIHIEEMTNEVTVVDGEMPLSDAQLDQIASLVMQRLSEKDQLAEHLSETAAIRRQFVPMTGIQS